MALFVVPLRASAASLSAADLMALVPGLTANEAQTLVAKGQVTRFFDGKGGPTLVPECSLTPAVQEGFSAVPHTIGAEALFIMKPGGGSHEARMLRWYNILRSVSTMKGIKYYSVTRGRTRVLFYHSYAINNLTEQQRLPDPLVTSIPRQSDLTIKQDDSTFGEAYFHLHYRAAPDSISMSMSNLRPLYLWFIKVIHTKKMMLQLVLMPYKGSLIFYGGVEVKTLSLFGLQNLTRDSFINRIEALHGWFKNQESER